MASPSDVDYSVTHSCQERLGGCSRFRTYDPLIKSQLLYQLSYAPAPNRGAPYSEPARL